MGAVANMRPDLFFRIVISPRALRRRDQKYHA